jgi:hypothetical protein
MFGIIEKLIGSDVGEYHFNRLDTNSDAPYANAFSALYGVIDL